MPEGWQLIVDEAVEEPAGSAASYGISPPATAAEPGIQSKSVEEWLAQLRKLSNSARWVLGGGIVVVIGSLLPWISPRGFVSVFQVSGGARFLSVLLGLALIASALIGSPALAGSLQRYRFPARLGGLVVAGICVLFYCGLTIAGWVGTNTDIGFGLEVPSHWDPAFGLVLCFAGAVSAGVANALLLTGKNKFKTDS